MVEEWKPIKGFEGAYEVSNFGRVKSLARKNLRGNNLKEKMLRAGRNQCGYYYVTLCGINGHKQVSLQRLVAITFIPNPNGWRYVNHKDENPANNRVDNLEWCTCQYNINYGNSPLKMRIKRGRAILQLDKQGNIIARFPSAMEAYRTLGIDFSRICRCARGDKWAKTAGGYKWRYCDDC